MIAFCSPDGLSVTRGAAAPGDTAATAAGDGGTSAAAGGAAQPFGAAVDVVGVGLPLGRRRERLTWNRGCGLPSALRRRGARSCSLGRAASASVTAAADGDGGWARDHGWVRRAHRGRGFGRGSDGGVELTAGGGGARLRDDEGGRKPRLGRRPPSPAAARLPAPPPARATAASNLTVAREEFLRLLLLRCLAPQRRLLLRCHRPRGGAALGVRLRRLLRRLRRRLSRPPPPPHPLSAASASFLATSSGSGSSVPSPRRAVLSSSSPFTQIPAHTFQTRAPSTTV